jgi:hypothetical protein
MGCGCGGKKNNAGLRGVGKRPITAPRQNTQRQNQPSAQPMSFRPTQPNPTTVNYNAQRREIERKRRVAIMKALGK